MDVQLTEVVELLHHGNVDRHEKPDRVAHVRVRGRSGDRVLADLDQLDLPGGDRGGVERLIDLELEYPGDGVARRAARARIDRLAVRQKLGRGLGGQLEGAGIEPGEVPGRSG
jgi:hypothetical protein